MMLSQFCDLTLTVHSVVLGPEVIIGGNPAWIDRAKNCQVWPAASSKIYVVSVFVSVCT